jgi:YrbI family 3-deoxy-D-manno-octulosonate 8-phosphate phosphatase
MDRSRSVTLKDRCLKIELLILDVDGVLTDGGIVYADNQVELKEFFVRDGSGLKLWQRAGKQSAIITGRKSPVVDIRAAEVGIAHVIQGAAEKVDVFHGLLRTTGLSKDQACFLGDDIPDVPVLAEVGLATAVADACPEAILAAQYVTKAPGGRGAVREVIELILRCQGRWV